MFFEFIRRSMCRMGTGCIMLDLTAQCHDFLFPPKGREIGYEIGATKRPAGLVIKELTWPPPQVVQIPLMPDRF